VRIGVSRTTRVAGYSHWARWTHTCRHHARKAQADPSRDGQSKMALDLIGQLYRIERDIKTASAEERLRVRKSQFEPIVRELKDWLDKMAGAVLLQSALGKAVHYMLGQFTKLTPFIDHPQSDHRRRRRERASVLARRVGKGERYRAARLSRAPLCRTA
jgi:transposase